MIERNGWHFRCFLLEIGAAKAGAAIKKPRRAARFIVIFGVFLTTNEA
jgi:hypothetical protein